MTGKKGIENIMTIRAKKGADQDLTASATGQGPGRITVYKINP